VIVAKKETGRIKMRIRRNDEVVVIAGRDKGVRGKVLRVLPKEGRVIVANVNIVKKHLRPTQTSKGGIVEKEAPIHVSNVMFFCPHCKKGVRLGAKILDDGRKVRICRSCGEIVDS